MELLFSGYVIYSLSLLLIFISLALILNLQFSITGIVNFGIVGFWGLGMYTFSLLIVHLNMPFVIALILASVITGIISMGFGKVILDLDEQAILVATLSFAKVIEYLATTEKWLTKGAFGLGTIDFPFEFGKYDESIYLLIILILTILLILYVAKLKSSPYGRLLISIKDNEVLSQSLGKPTLRHKIIFFAVSCALLGLFGGLTAPIYNYIFPLNIRPGVTFTIWIALMLGGKNRVFGGVVGVIATVGLFDYFIESVVTMPTQYAALIPNLKFALYGLTLILVLMFRPLGILGDKKKKKKEVVR